jgi:hypothetical protein
MKTSDAIELSRFSDLEQAIAPANLAREFHKNDAPSLIIKSIA